MDPVAPCQLQTLAAELFSRCRDEVETRVRRRFPSVDPDQLHDAFVKAVLELAKKPEVLDARRGTWPALLYGATRRNLRGLYRSDKARRKRESKKGLALVAERESAARNPLEELVDGEALRTSTTKAQIIRAELARTDEERHVLQLWEQGVTDLGEWACALSVEGHTPQEQEAHVQRTRKRLMKRMERLRQRLAEEATSP
jgi:hypothetical protein